MWNRDIFVSPNRDFPRAFTCLKHGHETEGNDNIVHLTSQQLAQVFNRGCGVFEPNCEQRGAKTQEKS